MDIAGGAGQGLEEQGVDELDDGALALGREQVAVGEVEQALDIGPEVVGGGLGGVGGGPVDGCVRGVDAGGEVLVGERLGLDGDAEAHADIEDGGGVGPVGDEEPLGPLVHWPALRSRCWRAKSRGIRRRKGSLGGEGSTEGAGWVPVAVMVGSSWGA
jgi:hypothetical protein